MNKPLVKCRPAAAQDIFFIFDVILYLLDWIEEVYRIITVLFGSTSG